MGSQAHRQLLFGIGHLALQTPALGLQVGELFSAGLDGGSGRLDDRVVARVSKRCRWRLRARTWAHVSPLLNVPHDDPVEGAPDDAPLARLVGGRQRLKPEDLLAVAFNDLASRRMRGAPLPGQEVAALASNLRGLADALDACNNDSPGAFFVPT